MAVGRATRPRVPGVAGEVVTLMTAAVRSAVRLPVTPEGTNGTVGVGATTKAMVEILRVALRPVAWPLVEGRADVVIVDPVVLVVRRRPPTTPVGLYEAQGVPDAKGILLAVARRPTVVLDTPATAVVVGANTGRTRA